MRIKIIAIPPGFAPEDIRKQWVGIKIPLSENPIEKISFRIGCENFGGYEVRSIDAITALERAGKNDAAKFWLDYLGGHLVFKKEVCELIT